MNRAATGLAALLLAAACSLAGLRELAPDPPAAASPAALPAPSPTSTPSLGRLRIPDIGVDAPIDAVGLTPHGDLATPADVSHVGWYRAGSLPGAPGSSVIDGHLDWYSGPAVFADPPATLTSTRAMGAAPDQATPRMASSPRSTSAPAPGSVISARTRCSDTGSVTTCPSRGHSYRYLSVW